MDHRRVASRIKAAYPWQLWTDGKPRIARQGVDFFASTQSFRNVLYSYARKHGLMCHTSLRDNNEVYFRFWVADDA